jgi:hypothetical protein
VSVCETGLSHRLISSEGKGAMRSVWTEEGRRDGGEAILRMFVVCGDQGI